jgi:hypothetical protein
MTTRHTRREGVEDAVFYFFPGDIYRMFSHDVRPIRTRPVFGHSGGEINHGGE